jgi:hypothetical protein
MAAEGDVVAEVAGARLAMSVEVLRIRHTPNG